MLSVTENGKPITSRVRTIAATYLRGVAELDAGAPVRREEARSWQREGTPALPKVRRRDGRMAAWWVPADAPGVSQVVSLWLKRSRRELAGGFSLATAVVRVRVRGGELSVAGQDDAHGDGPVLAFTSPNERAAWLSDPGRELKPRNRPLQDAVLAALTAAGECSVSELAHRLNKHEGAVLRVVARMYEDGQVEQRVVVSRSFPARRRVLVSMPAQAGQTNSPGPGLESPEPLQAAAS